MKEKQLFKISKLLFIKLTTDLSEEQSVELKRRLEANNISQDLISGITKWERLKSKLHDQSQFDSQKAYNKFRESIKRKKKIYLYKAFLKYAAIFAIIACLAIVFGRDIISPGKQLIVETILPGESRATLILGDGTQISLEEVLDSAIQTGDGIRILKKNEVIDYRNSITEEEIYNTIRIPRGGEYTLVLSDGTKVFLNSDSELTYPVKFLGKFRKVSLKGEAYMIVASDHKMPFFVETSGSTVEVLGTEFNIRAYQDEEYVATTLVEGKVTCYKKGHRESAVSLIPGYQAVVSEGKELIEIKEVDTYLYTSWKDGMFVFDHLTLPEIFITLGRWYDMNVEFENEDLRRLHFSGDLERYENIGILLQMIEMTTNVKFEIEKKTVYVKEN